MKRRMNEWTEQRSKPRILAVEPVDNGDIDDRMVVVKLSNGSEVHIVACQESWEQFGATQDEMWVTVPVAKKYNDWLHGGEEPEYNNFNNESKKRNMKKLIRITESDIHKMVKSAINEIGDTLTGQYTLGRLARRKVMNGENDSSIYKYASEKLPYNRGAISADARKAAYENGRYGDPNKTKEFNKFYKNSDRFLKSCFDDGYNWDWDDYED